MKTKDEIIENFNEYIKRHGQEPDAILCSVRFYDDEEDMEVCIKLNCEVDNPFDDKFFFYCKHINGLLSVLGEDSNYEDFYVREVYEFINSKEYFV